MAVVTGSAHVITQHMAGTTEELIGLVANSGARIGVTTNAASSQTFLRHLKDFCGSAGLQVEVFEPRRMPSRDTDDRAVRILALDLLCQPSVTGMAGHCVLAAWHELKSQPDFRRIYFAFQSLQSTTSGSLCLSPGNDRNARDANGRAVLFFVSQCARALGLLQTVSIRAPDTLEETHTVAPCHWQSVFIDRTQKTLLQNGGGYAEGMLSDVVFPGAFNPFHAGHREIAQVARSMYGKTVAWELSITNVDKPVLDYTEIAQRARQFEADDRVWLTRSPTFVEKSRLFPGATFLVGADTIRRIVDPQYYGGDTVACERAISEIAELGCRFSVFGRVVNNRFHILSDLNLPASLRALCDEVPQSLFRADISSTQLRLSASREND